MSKLATLLRSVRNLTLFGICTGLVASFCTLLFTEAVFWLNDHLFVSSVTRSTLMPEVLLWVSLLVPAVGGLIVGILLYFSPDKCSLTPADVIGALAQNQPLLGIRRGVFTASASILSLGSGASAGQYGPLVHLGATLGSQFSRLPGFGRHYAGIGMGCGIAAAISTAFAAPIAGVVFAHEVLLRHNSLRAFAPITIAAVTGSVLANNLFTQGALLPVREIADLHTSEFLSFVLLGVLGALVAILLMRGLELGNQLCEKIPLPSWAMPALAGLALGLAAIWLPEILGTGLHTLRQAIAGILPDTTLMLIFAAKILATIVCLSFGFAGGVFSPALVIGALLGAIFAGFADAWYVNFQLDVAVYAICGMAAVASAVIGAPLTTILIVFEITRNYELTTAVMVAVVFSNLVASRMYGRSYFDRQLLSRGIDLSQGLEKVRLQHQGISPYINREIIILPASESVEGARRHLQLTEQSEAHLVDDNSRYAGTISLSTMVAEENKDLEVPVSELVTQTLVLTESTSIWNALQALKSFVGESVPVIDNTGRLTGVIYESSLIQAYLDLVEEIRREENAIG